MTAGELRSRIDADGLGDRVELVGPLSHERVWDEYADADLFVYPSQLESFGLPPLEAMVAGVPVITSSAPSVREVVGDAARVVDVTRAERFAACIAELLDVGFGAPRAPGGRPAAGRDAGPGTDAAAGVLARAPAAWSS